MAEFDSLEIKVITDADKATSAVDNLSKSFGNLNKSLDIKNANKLPEISKSIKDMAANLSKSYEIDKSGFNDLAVALNNIKNAYRGVFEAQASSKMGTASKELVDNLRQAGIDATKIVQKLSSFKIEGNADVRAFKEELKGLKFSVTDALAHEAKGDVDFTYMREAINKELGQTVFLLKDYTTKIDEQGNRIRVAISQLSQLPGNLSDGRQSEQVFQGLQNQVEILAAVYEKLGLGVEQGTQRLSSAFQKVALAMNTSKDQFLSYEEAVQAGIAQAGTAAYDIKRLSAVLYQLAIREEHASNNMWRFADAISNMKGLASTVMPNEVGKMFDAFAKDAFYIDVTPRLNFDSVKQLPAVIYDNISPAFARIETEAQKASDFMRQVIENAFKMDMHMDGNPFDRFSTIIDTTYREVETSVSELSDHISKVGEKGAAAGEKLIGSFNQSSDTVNATTQSVDRLNEALDKIISRDYSNLIKLPGILPETTEELLDKTIRDFDWGKFKDSYKNIEPPQADNGLLEKLVGSFSVEHILEKLSGTLNKVGDTGLKISKLMITPLKAVVNEYKEKLERIGGFFENFRKKAQANLQKLSAFWKRTMKTFTFMLVRKAITAIIGNINEATQSLAAFSKEVGTAFNENMSNAVADLKWIAKAIIGAFEPVINFVVPILNVLSAALVKVITLLGEFFAALTGQSYYMVAKKKVDDYTGSLKKASKAANLALRPFDELNNLTTPKSGDDDSGTNPAADWDMKPVSDKMKKLADKIKDLAKKLWEPIKKAWDRTKDYVISGFKYMVGELGKLAKDIGRDFLKVWRQEATVKMFENIFKIVGDIERVIGNLAKRFREAWNEGSKGLHIFENIRDIFATLIQHVRNVTRYMIGWSDSIDFNPLLESIQSITKAFVKLADFIGGVFEDVMKNVVLKYIKWMIEEGTPHLLETITKIINAVDWEGVRRGLFIVEQAFESLLENVHTGVTNAIGLVGQAVADWLNSDSFIKFMQAIANIMNQITAERVEKVLGGLGLAIVNIAKGVADFISGDKFQKFIESIGKWIDNHSVEDIAKIAENIIKLTVACKILGSVLGGLAGAFSVLYKIKTLTIGSKLIKGLKDLGEAGKVAKEGLIDLPGLPGMKGGAGLSTILTGDIGANMAAGGATAGATFAAGFIGSVVAAIAGYNFGKLIGDKFIDSSGTYKDFKLFDLKNLFTGDIKSDLGDMLNAAIDMITDFKNNPAIATLSSVLAGPFISAEAWIAKFIRDDGFQKLGDGLKTTGENISRNWNNMTNDLKTAFGTSTESIRLNWENMKSDISSSVANIKENVSQNWNNMLTDISTYMGNIKTNVSQNWANIKTDVSTKLSEIKNDASVKWSEIKADATTKFTALKTEVTIQWTNIKTFLSTSLANIKAMFSRFSLAGVGSKIINSFLSGLRSAWQSVSTWLSNKAQEIKSKLNFNFSFGASGSQSVRRYATGGFPPEDGWFRASHGEMMGEFDNGQSVVANNEQIIEGIKNGVIDGMLQIMPTLAQAVQSGETNITLEGDMGKFFRAMVKENSGMNKRTFGSSPLLA